MKQTVIFFAIVIFLIISWLIGFINDLNEDVATHIRSREDNTITKRSNISVNSNGQDVLVLNKLTIAEKKRIWNSSDLKSEMIELFPDFTEMKLLINDELEDDGKFKKEILSNIERVEFGYIGGKLTRAGAKAEIMNF